MKLHPSSHKLLLVLFLLTGLAGSTAAQRHQLTLVNTSEKRIRTYPVVMPLSDLPEQLRSERVRVYFAGGKALVSQVDDLNGDGTPDELAFRIEIPASESRDVVLELAPKTYGRGERVTGAKRGWLMWRKPVIANRSVKWQLPRSRSHSKTPTSLKEADPPPRERRLQGGYFS